VITEHIHPHQEERFTILAGEAHFTLGGQEHVAGASETIVVPAGVPHSEGRGSHPLSHRCFVASRGQCEPCGGHSIPGAARGLPRSA
jgi:quercetin dioxygenase-like cupin family protein